LLFLGLFRYPTYQIFLTATISVMLTVALTPLFIRLLSVRSIGQQIRADGPQAHLVKQGTPTMGGVVILASIILAVILGGRITPLNSAALGAMVGCGLVGLADDRTKVVRKRSLGLTARAKIACQLIVAAALGTFAVNVLHISTWVMIPMTGRGLDLGLGTVTLTLWKVPIQLPLLYIALVLLMVVATTNAVNLTDGLDGLAAGTVAIVMLAFAGIAFRQNHLDLALVAAAASGSCIGFLWYNAYPADIFMGDTGALGLGGAIAALAILTKTELLLVVIGGIYVVETLSVILQIAVFKLMDGKRLFKMAPIHHHFEMLGWSETKVMIRFWIVTGLVAGIGFALYFLSVVRVVKPG
jgi:phospho-N-acetylmuramoyl-pentapeptide-transferase